MEIKQAHQRILRVEHFPVPSVDIRVKLQVRWHVMDAPQAWLLGCHFFVNFLIIADKFELNFKVGILLQLTWWRCAL